MGLLEVLEQARTLGFLGPGPVEDHLRHAEAFAAALASPPTRALDLGSGGGVPGLVLATQLAASRWTLLDSLQKRTAFLADAVAALGLGDRVQVVTDRAEAAGRTVEHRGGYDVVVARSFGPPAVLAECAAPFLEVSGLLVVSEPPAENVGRWSQAGLAELGLAELDVLAGPPRLRRFRQSASCPDRYPRRTGIPAKRPLW